MFFFDFVLASAGGYAGNPEVPGRGRGVRGRPRGSGRGRGAARGGRGRPPRPAVEIAQPAPVLEPAQPATSSRGRGRFRHWVFTLNHYTDADQARLRNVVPDVARYVVFGREVAPQTGDYPVAAFPDLSCVSGHLDMFPWFMSSLWMLNA